MKETIQNEIKEAAIRNNVTITEWHDKYAVGYESENGPRCQAVIIKTPRQQRRPYVYVAWSLYIPTVLNKHNAA